jgi:NAD(P)-dependent dehydrogenase (short-subunit alcohol dehydrogenase family)
MIRFDDRVAVVTGAGTGLGREYARLLAARGARVVVNDLGGSVAGDGGSAPPAESVAQEILAAGGHAIANCDSVADRDGAARIVEAALREWGRIDILINNAGIMREAPLDGIALDTIEIIVAVHLMGTLYCTRAALPAMREQGYGRIVLTSSGAGLTGLKGQSVYGAAKTAMLGLMNCMRFDLDGTGVLVNTVAPSAATRMSQGIIKEELARNMQPGLVAPMVVWLASEQCRDTGQLLTAAAGYYSKVAMYKSEGVQFDPTAAVTLEMFDSAWSRIIATERVEPYRGTMASLENNLRKLGLV